MNGKIHVALGLSIFAIVCIFVMQLFWLQGTLELKKEEYQGQINATLTSVVETGFEEYLMKDQEQALSISVNKEKRQIRFLKDNQVQTFSYESDYGYMSLMRKICYDLLKNRTDQNLESLDEICKVFFRNKKITERYILEIIDTKAGVVIATTERDSSRFVKRMNSDILELGLTSHHGLIAYFDVPNKTFYMKMMGTVVSSILLVLLFVFCLVYQLKIISFQLEVGRMREEFMCNLVHELKQPLVGMQNGLVATRVYGLDNLTKDQRNMFDIMFNRVTHLCNFVFKFLIVWKQGFSMSWNKLNLRKVIDAVVEQFNPAFTVKHVSFKIDYQLDVDIIEADELHFPNMISNLVENAIKYSGDDPKIEIRCKREGGMLSVSVKDYGIGIPDKFRERIFDKYFRVNDENNTAVFGFGIGLSYVKQVVEAHEGLILVESELDVGTTFTVKIPLEAKE